MPVSVRPDMDDRPGLEPGVDHVRPAALWQLDDPIDRLQAIHDGTKGAKEEHNALGPTCCSTGPSTPPPTSSPAPPGSTPRMRLADRHRPIANLVISNVPGPDFPLYLAGAELVAGFPLGPVMDGMGVNITVMSYRGVLNWGIHAMPGHHPPALEPDRRHPAGPRRAARRRRGGALPTYRSEDAAAAVRASGINVEPPG